MTDPWKDMDREEGTLTRVEIGAEYHSVTSSNGWSCSVEAKYGTPVVGDPFVTWGSIGRPIRGMALRGKVLFYRTPEEQATKDAREIAEQRVERMANYEGRRSQFDQRVAVLPELLRRRIEGFRERGGDEWRWELEPYELMCCEQAAAIAQRFPTPADLVAFAALDYPEQKAAFPEMDDGHSGNSWSFSLRLARTLLERPDLLERMHGALCPLVGCADSHCWSTVAA